VLNSIVGFVLVAWRWDDVRVIAAAITALLAFVTAVTGVGTRLVKWLIVRYHAWRYETILGKSTKGFEPGVINRATRWYIIPRCQRTDPNATEDSSPPAKTEKLYGTIDRMLADPANNKFIFLLADSGMGKTSFLLNYSAYHNRAKSRR
jgi:hypothetical protein